MLLLLPWTPQPPGIFRARSAKRIITDRVDKINCHPPDPAWFSRTFLRLDPNSDQSVSAVREKARFGRHHAGLGVNAPGRHGARAARDRRRLSPVPLIIGPQITRPAGHPRDSPPRRAGRIAVAAPKVPPGSGRIRAAPQAPEVHP